MKQKKSYIHKLQKVKWTSFSRNKCTLEMWIRHNFFRKDIAERLNLEGSQQQSAVTSALWKPNKIDSAIILVNTSSSAMKDSSKLSAWLVNNLDISFNKYDTSKIKQRFSHLSGIEFPQLKYLNAAILTGTDHADLLLYREFRDGWDGEPMAVKTKSGWMLMEGSKPIKREGWCNFLCDNSSSTTDQNVKNFWSLESYETLPKLSSELLPRDEKTSVNTLSLKKLLLLKINMLREVYYGKVMYHIYQLIKMGINCLESLEKRFQQNSDFAKLCHDQIKDYTALGHAHQLILLAPTPKNGQIQASNSSATADELFEYVWPFCGVSA